MRCDGLGWCRSVVYTAQRKWKICFNKYTLTCPPTRTHKRARAPSPSLPKRFVECAARWYRLGLLLRALVWVRQASRLGRRGQSGARQKVIVPLGTGMLGPIFILWHRRRLQVSPAGRALQLCLAWALRSARFGKYELAQALPVEIVAAVGAFHPLARLKIDEAYRTRLFLCVLYNRAERVNLVDAAHVKFALLCKGQARRGAEVLGRYVPRGWQHCKKCFHAIEIGCVRHTVRIRVESWAHDW